MILFEERKSEKLPGINSIFISFEYNKYIVEAVKSIPNATYDKKNYTWEIPICYLAKAIAVLNRLDSIKLLCAAEKSPEYKTYEIGPFKTKPFSYQEDAIQYALNHEKFMLLDGMGLGKSLQSIYAAEEIKKRYGIEHCLVICGVNTLKSNWKKEINTHSNLSCKILGEKISKTGKTTYGGIKERLEQLKNPIEEFFVVTNIETLRNDDIIKTINANKPNKFDMIIFDEMHKAKSASSEQGKNLLKLNKARFKIGLTGTLLLNSPFDCYVPLKWLGVQNCTLTSFKYFYGNFGGPFNNDLISYKNIDTLKDVLSTCSLRRTKDILDLPPKTIINEYVDMADDQLKFYENIKNGIKDQVDKVDLNTATLLSLVTRLRQATACPSILTSEKISSAKIERAIDLIEQIVSQGDKVVVFSTFIDTVDSIKNKILHLDPLVCTGSTKDIDIQKNIDTFQTSDENKVMLCTWQKMGTGVTLTAATYAIFIDCPWTAALCTQSEDRIYRIGSKSPVFIYYLWTKNTIDERVYDIVKSKQAMSDYVIDDAISSENLSMLRKYITDL